MQKKDGINEEPTLSGKQRATEVQIPGLGYWHKYKCITGQAGFRLDMIIFEVVQAICMNWSQDGEDDSNDV